MPAKEAPSDLIDQAIANLNDWRGETVAKLRKVVLSASPDIVEAWKWGTPVWECDGLVCGAGAFKAHVKLHFFKGAHLSDPGGVFNAGASAKDMRAVDFREGDKVDSAALKKLVQEAIKFNRS